MEVDQGSGKRKVGEVIDPERLEQGSPQQALRVAAQQLPVPDLDDDMALGEISCCSWGLDRAT